MAFDEKLNDRLREALADVPKKIEEKHMFGGVCYMVNGKMCVGIVKDELMCRIGPNAYEAALKKPGCHEMIFTGKPMKGYVFVNEEGMKTKKDLEYWVNLSLKFNDEAKSSKKTPAKKTKKK
ncbi:MAG: TfoX/Sxy family protein [Bacteroidetes bacterium]|jgi:TfoX/Sxy family transcriptional regulator of competence genes|nr:TfoX/Sxy family protein [Bacteroidota bacterium]